MSELSNIPAHAVLPLAGFNVDNLRRGADRFDQQVLECDLSGTLSVQDVVKVLGKSFGLVSADGTPVDIRRQLEALYARLTNFKLSGDKPGLLVLLQNIPNAEKLPASDRDALLDVFREVADFFFEKNTAFRVFYSYTKS